MKFINILTFIAGLAIAHGAVIPENKDDNELLSSIEDNAVAVDAEIVEVVESDNENNDDFAALSDEENEVDAAGNDDEVQAIESDEENEVDAAGNDNEVQAVNSDDENAVSVSVSNEEVSAVVSDDEPVNENTTTVEPVIVPTTTVEPVVVPTTTVEPVVEQTTTVDVPSTTTEVEEPTQPAPIELIPGPVTCTYKKKDTDDKFDVKSDNQIKLEGTNGTVKGKGAEVSEGIVTITEAGNYIIEGEFQGQIRVSAGEKDFIHLILNEVNVKSEEGPALSVLSAEKVTITLVGKNKLTDSENYDATEKAPDACLYAKSDISINGEGELDITAKYGTAFHCTKDLKLVSGNINVDAKDKGIKVKNSICVHEANIYVNSVNSALKVTNKEKADKGFIVIENGNVTISTENDAIHAETHLSIYDGFIDIKDCNEGIEGQMIDILGGDIHISTHNDGINASYIAAVKQERGGPPPPPPPMDPNDPNGFVFGPPPVGPEANDGSMYINIVGGRISIVAHDNMDIDGIDSNGILYIGGDAEIYVDLQYGKIYGDFAALDSDGDNVIAKGATVVATATNLTWEYAEQFMTEEEKQNRPPPPPITIEDKGSIFQSYIRVLEMEKQPAKTEIVLKDKKGTVVASYTPDYGYDLILITSPKLVAGETYELTAGSFVKSIVAEKADEGSYKTPSTVDGTKN